MSLSRFNLRLLLAAVVVLAAHGSARADSSCGKQDFSLNVPQIVKNLQKDPCENKGTSVVVDLYERILFLCESGVAKKGYRVSIGTSGFPKVKEGDKKSPVGAFELGKPRVSNDGFHVFIPVGYPNVEQMGRGFTGQDIGIHGPPREDRCAGEDNVSYNWTDGCIALPDDTSIETVAKFVKRFGSMKVHLTAKWR